MAQAVAPAPKRAPPAGVSIHGVGGEGLAEWIASTTVEGVTFFLCEVARGTGPAAALAPAQCWVPEKDRRQVLTSVRLPEWFPAKGVADGSNVILAHVMEHVLVDFSQAEAGVDFHPIRTITRHGTRAVAVEVAWLSPRAVCAVLLHILRSNAVHTFYHDNEQHRMALRAMLDAVTTNRLDSILAGALEALRGSAEQAAEAQRAADRAKEAQRQEALAAAAHVREQLAATDGPRTGEVVARARSAHASGDPALSPRSPTHAEDLPCRSGRVEASRLVRENNMDIGDFFFGRVVAPAAVAEWMITVGLDLTRCGHKRVAKAVERNFEGLGKADDGKVMLERLLDLQTDTVAIEELGQTVAQVRSQLNHMLRGAEPILDLICRALLPCTTSPSCPSRGRPPA